MAERLADVVTQIQNIRQLDAVVTAMRGIAASRAQHGASLLAGIDAYSDRGVARDRTRRSPCCRPDAAAAATPRARKLGLILFCAEQGLRRRFQ